MRRAVSVMATVAVLAAVAAISFAFAVAGEPQSRWLWSDVLGAI